MADRYKLTAADFSYYEAIRRVREFIREKQNLETDEAAMEHWNALNHEEQVALLKEALE